MKKQSKLLVLILALSLLVCAAVGITASANDESPTVSIESYNVSHGGELSLYYAVNTANAGDYATVGVKLSLEPASVAERAVYEATASETLYNNAYPVFYSFGIPAKNIDDVIYATPYATYADGSTVEGDEVAYSVLEYCYQMILVDADAKAEAGDITADKAAQLKSSLRSLVTYAKDMMLYKDEAAANYPENHYYVAVEGGTVNGSSYVYSDSALESAELVLTEQIPENGAFLGWNVIGVDGSIDVIETAETSYTVNIGSSCLVSPIFEVADGVVSFEPFDIEKNYTDYSGSAVSDSITQLLGLGNHSVSSSTSAKTTFKVHNQNIAEATTVAERVTTLEFKLYLDESIQTTNAATAAVLYFKNAAADANMYQIVIGVQPNSPAISMRSNQNSKQWIFGDSTSATGAYNLGEWNTFKIEFFQTYKNSGEDDRSECGAKLWVNGSFAGSTNGQEYTSGGTTNVTNGVNDKATNGYGLSCVTFELYEKAGMYVDDISLSEDTSGTNKFIDGVNVKDNATE